MHDLAGNRKPVVLSISGHDPTGGAGIQADIEAIRAQRCHPATLITCLTRQDTRNVYAIDPLDPDELIRQAQTLFQDMSIDVIKVGLVGSADNINAIGRILQDHVELPVVLDPILAAGGGQALSSTAIIEAMRDVLIPLTTVITPNLPEAEKLSGETEKSRMIQALAGFGADHILLTGTHADTQAVENSLYRQETLVATHQWPRLEQQYHGSGCTLAASLAAALAQGLKVPDASLKAQDYTWQSLKNGYPLGQGQWLPERLG